MRKLAITLPLSLALVLAGTALAALPSPGAFAGKTSLHSINGFPSVVTFVAAKNRLALRKFTFETLGCFGTGAFPAGVDPYGMAAALGTVSSIPLTKTGTFAVTLVARFAESDGVVTTATIAGSVLNASSVQGTITVTQSANGDKCGPSKMKFTAVPGTPDSLGFTG